MMKKTLLYFVLAGGASMMSASMTAQSTLSQAEKDARTAYFKAVDRYENGDYNDAIKFVEQAEAKLTNTNARLSYLKTKALFAQKKYLEAQKSCSNYFSSKPMKDDGFAEMNALSTEIALRVDSINAKVVEQRAESEQKAKAAAAQAEQRAILMKQASARRAADVANQEKKKEEELLALKAVQSKGTKEAYQQYIYDYPYGAYTSQARSEMSKKFPSPTKVLRKNKYGYINKAGELVIKAKYDYASDFSEGMARVAKEGKYGFIDETGKEIVPLNYMTASNYSYGWAVLKTAEDEFFFVNKKGEKMSDVIYNDAKSFNEGLAAVENEFFQYGFVNTAGDEVIPCQFHSASWFKEGLASVAKKMSDGKVKWGYINKTGYEITEFVFDEAKDFQGGVAIVKQNGKYGLIDKFGSPITECEFDYISSFGGDGHALAKKNGWDVYLDKEGVAWAKANGKYVKVNY